LGRDSRFFEGRQDGNVTLFGAKTIFIKTMALMALRLNSDLWKNPSNDV
jgi:hypothetical protein